MEESVLSNLVTPDQYQEGRKHVFPAPQSLDWYVRNHRSKLVECGAVLLIAKRQLTNEMLAVLTACGLRPD